MKSTVGICVMKTYQMIIIKTDHLDEKGRETFEEALEDFCDCTFYGNPPKNDSHLKVEFSHNAVKITEKEILHETLKIQR